MDVCEDSMFPFKLEDDYVYVKVSFKVGEKDRLLIEKWVEEKAKK
jgi:hypothetical protein